MLRLVDWFLFRGAASSPLFWSTLLPCLRYFCPRITEVENAAGPKISVFPPPSYLSILSLPQIHLHWQSVAAFSPFPAPLLPFCSISRLLPDKQRPTDLQDLLFFKPIL